MPTASSNGKTTLYHYDAAGRKAGPMADILGLDKVDMEGIPAQWRGDIEKHLSKLYGTYDSKLESIRMSSRDDAKGFVTGGTKMSRGRQSFSNREQYINVLKSEISDGAKVDVDKNNLSLYTATHEFGHTLFNTSFSNKSLIDEMKIIRVNYYASLQKAGSDELSKLFLSEYAKTNLNEFFTEGFTQYILNSKPSGAAQEIGTFVEKYLRKK